MFAGIMSNMASEIGYVLLVPLAALIFQAAGRHPVAGLAAAFAGVSGGYSANLLLGTIDPLLAGLTEEAARLVDPTAQVSPAANYLFMVASIFLISAVGTLVTEWVVEPRLGTYEGEAADGDALRGLTREERRGLVWALVAALLLSAWVLAGTVPAGGFLRDPENDGLLRSPFLSGIVALIFFAGAACGIAYGIGAGTVRSDADVMKSMGRSMETLGGYLVLVFFAAQFVAFLMSYFALVIAFFQRYDPRAGIGTLVATMLPYTIAFTAAWSVLLVVWMLLELPLGF